MSRIALEEPELTEAQKKDFKICAVCGRLRKCSHEPSRSTLISFNMKLGPKYEYRCAPCEKKLVESINRLFKSMGPKKGTRKPRNIHGG